MKSQVFTGYNRFRRSCKRVDREIRQKGIRSFINFIYINRQMDEHISQSKLFYSMKEKKETETADKPDLNDLSAEEIREYIRKDAEEHNRQLEMKFRKYLGLPL